MKLYHFVCAAALAVAPMAAMAQTSPRTQDEPASTQQGYAKTDPAHPGATGKTVVPGTHSSVKTNRAATMQQKKSSVTGK